MHWRVNFDGERIRSLSLFAATLSPELDAYERYAKRNHFFTYGMDAEEREKERQAVHQALAGLKAYIHRAQTAGNETPGDGGAWLNELPQALAADVNIMSPKLRVHFSGPFAWAAPARVREQLHGL